MPAALHFVLPAFYELGSRRPYTQGTPLPITHAEIVAWQQLYRRSLKDWELEALKLLDSCWLKAMNSGGRR